MPIDIFTLVEALWLIIPAYAANGLVPLLRFKKKVHAIDGGRKLGNQHIFGSSKTWEGIVLGTVIGMAIALVEMFAYPFLPFSQSSVPLTIVAMSATMGLLLGLGAMVGDLAGSFVKRRLNIGSGKPAPILDQVDFLIGAFVFASLIVALKWEWVVILLVITPIIHYLACVVGYLLKIKKEPW